MAHHVIWFTKDKPAQSAPYLRVGMDSAVGSVIQRCVKLGVGVLT